MSRPQFAVVGRVNRGKSSIVAALVEDDSILIGPEPGTTTRCRYYPVKIDQKVMFEVIDTPGFQCPEQMLEILQELKAAGHSYQTALQEFYHRYAKSEDFQDECQILEPILNGAKVIYVVDASKPFRQNMATELEILRWTGAARIAVLNHIGNQDYSKDWEVELRRSFNLIRKFNAFHSRFHDRIQLLKDFRLIDPSAAPAIDAAIRTLEQQNRDRLEKCAELISELLKDSAIDSIKIHLPSAVALSKSKAEIRERAFRRYEARFINKEKATRKKIEEIFNYKNIERIEDSLGIKQFSDDLLTKEGWRLWGLSQGQFIKLLAISGASSGLILDLFTAGFGIITLSGVILGGTAAYLASRKTIRQLLAIKQLGLDEIEVGPIKSAQFYVVILHRALAHFHFLQLRTHAMRSDLEINHERARAVIKEVLSGKDLKEFFEIMRQISKKKAFPKYREPLQEVVLGALKKLGQSPMEDEPSNTFHV